jgi:hypothetical protein
MGTAESGVFLQIRDEFLETRIEIKSENTGNEIEHNYHRRINDTAHVTQIFLTQLRNYHGSAHDCLLFIISKVPFEAGYVMCLLLGMGIS